MEAKISESLNLTKSIYSDKTIMELKDSVRFCSKFEEEQRSQMLNWSHLWPINEAFEHRLPGFKASCAPQQSPVASVLKSKSECFNTEEDLILKNKSQEIGPHLDGRCLYLVGMMGSGKTTIGQILSEVLPGYSFFDSDKLIEKAAGGTTVADIFKLHGESFFRENETEMLRKLSSMYQLVISTGGGVVVQPINWKYMHKGITVFLDVPLEVLARRITAVGTTSRPLLHHGSGDAYVKTFRRLSVLWKERSDALLRLSVLWKERSDAYNNAHVTVSLGNIALKLGHVDVSGITPTQIAIEQALVQIKSYLKK